MGNQSSQTNNKEGNKQRKRDFLLNMCMNKQHEVQNDSKYNKNLSNFMNHKDIFNRLIDEEMAIYQVKIIQYVLNYLTIQESLSLRLVNRKMKFVVEFSSNIYASYLSQIYLRQIQTSNFIEYGGDSRFKIVYSEMLLKIELNQDESWHRIYCAYQKSIQQLKYLNIQLQAPFDMCELILNTLTQPLLPIAILTDDCLKKSTTSWFQLFMAQNQEEINCNVNQNELFNEFIESLFIDCLGQYSTQNLQHMQLLLELRWVIVDNFIKDPSFIKQDVPLLFKIAALILHVIYLRCLFNRNVLMIIKNNKVQAQLLNFYIILWRSFMGTIWKMNLYFESIFLSIAKLFSTFYNTKIPDFSFITIAGRIWTQVVLKGQNNNEIFNDSLEIELLKSFSLLLNEKRYQILEFFIKDQGNQQIMMSSQIQCQLFQDQYFSYISSAINCLLGHFTSSLLDISLHEQSIHWIGHSKLAVGQPYSTLLENIVQDSHTLFQKASSLFGNNAVIFQEYLQADSKYLQEVLNKWTVQIIIIPIGLNYSYEKIQTNLRTIILHQKNQLQFEDERQESMILPQNQQLILKEEFEPQSQIQVNDILDNMILQILKQEPQLNIQLKQYSMPPNIKQGYSVVDDTCSGSKCRELSQFSMSNKSSQITQWTSQYSQQLSHFSNSQEQIMVKQLSNQISNSPWSKWLQAVRHIEKENQILIDNRNIEIEQRNFIRKIPISINQQIISILDFNYVPQIEKLMLVFHQRSQIEQVEKIQNQQQFVEIISKGSCLADCVNQLEN